jgi:hypothetical protein
MDAVRRKRPEIWRSNIQFLFHDNVPVHRLVLVMDFVAKSNVTTLEHPPDSIPVEFYPFLQTKSALKGRRFCDDTDIIRNVTKELKRLLQKVSRMFPIPAQWLTEVHSCTKGLF